ncbi:MAG: caspase family protein [Sedimentisphaerales bacterium]|nr:caspase family protein [Sedimentisphaerales bacterium]
MCSRNFLSSVVRLFVLVIYFLVLFDTFAYCKAKTSLEAVPQKLVKKPAHLSQSVIPSKPAIDASQPGGTSFLEVEVLIGKQFTLEYLTGLPYAPESKPRVLGKPRRVILQLPAEQVEMLINKGANVRKLRNFVLVEGTKTNLKTDPDTVTPKATGSCAGQNNNMVYIPDYPYGWVYSEIPISCAPAGSTVISIDVHFEIYHTYPSDLVIDLTDEDLVNGCEIHLFENEYDSSYFTRTFTGLSVCNGRPVNQSWRLWAYDTAYEDEGYIDNWWIRVYYETGGCTPPVHDDCGNAIAVSAGIPYAGSSLCATGTDVTSCGQNDTADVWHSFTPATTGQYTVSLCGSSFDTTLAVFNECWVDELACNDNSSACGAGSSQSEIEVALNAGHQYLIRVSGVNGATGNYQLTVTPDETQPPDGITTCRAVVCGIADYQYIGDLTWCDDDAIDVRNALLAAGNWSSANITLLTNSAATKAAIRTAIQNMASASDSDDLCLFFFSGHGTTVNDQPPYDETDGYDELLAVYDSDTHVNQYISDDELGSWFDALPTNKYVILLDACHSGGQIKGAGTVKGFGSIVPQKGDGFAADLVPQIGIKDLDDNGRGVVITACDDDETSQESSLLENGIFTYCLVKGMGGPADSDSDGRISAEECYIYTGPCALTYYSGQHAQIYDAYTGELDFLGQETEPEYCSPTGTCGFEHVRDVQVGSINNTGTSCGTNGYTDYTSLSTNMQVGNSYPISINTGSPYPEDQLGIWVDWNQDKDFDDASETITVSGTPASGLYSATIIPPAGALTGNTRMRIRVIWNVSPNPCGYFQWSEAEDYTINLTAPQVPVTISGYVRNASGTPIEDVYVSASTGQNDTTDSAGFYELTAMSPWSVTVTPSKAEWVFTPSSKLYTNVTTNQTNQNYTGKYSYCGGTGTAEDTYLICTAEQMNRIGLDANDWNKHFKLVADIDLGGFTGNSFNIIGTNITPFLGVFDGDGYKIHNFTYQSQDAGPVGIFGVAGREEPLPGQPDIQAEIKNVGLISPVVSGDHGGTLVASFERGILSNCYATDVSVSMSGRAGGLIGARIEGSAFDCHVTGQISGGDYTGGLAGSWWGAMSRCSASCEISGNNKCGGLFGQGTGGDVNQCYANCIISGAADVGGLIGSAGWGSVQDSYAVGAVSGTNRTGGLIGDIYENPVYKCYAASEVNGFGSRGGLIGNSTDSAVSASFWDTDVSALSGSAGGTGKTTAQMQTLSTFIDAWWDFINETANGTEDIWYLTPKHYPRFAWEGIPPQVVSWQIGAIHSSVGDIWCEITSGYVEPRNYGVKELYVCFDMEMDTSITEFSDIISIEGVNGGAQSVSGWTEWWDDNCLVISLDEPLPDEDTYAITITSNVKSASGVPIDESSICITALKGDANGDRSVIAGDLLFIRGPVLVNPPVDSSNARFDINCDGAITPGDLLAARLYVLTGNKAPSCP